MWRGSLAPLLLTLALGQGVVSFTARPLYPWGNRSKCPLDKRLSGPQDQIARYGEEKNLAPAKNQTPALQPIAHLYID
jgi:hypothetical protein